jgi:osmotically-inducible protein OsmY
MKTTSLALIVASALCASLSSASDTHDADHALESGLRATLNEKHVHIHVHKGIVTLEGRVPTEADRQRLETMVRNTPGVVAVKDELKVNLPSPGAYGTPPSVPVYATPPPEIAPTAPVVTMPAPVIVPEYPKLKVQAWTDEDQPTANRIARQMRADAVPTAGFDNVVVTARNGTVSVKGSVDSQSEHDAIIAAIQRAGGISSIYDQLLIH